MYNEEKVVSLFFSAIDKVLAQLTQYAFELVIVNDGSKDGTYQSQSISFVLQMRHLRLGLCARLRRAALC